MKSINVYFDNEEYEILKKEKERRKVSWKELILKMLEENHGKK